MRLFIAIDIPEHVREILRQIQKRLSDQTVFKVRLVKPEHFHVTLLFLGEVKSEKLLLIQQGLHNIKLLPFELCIQDVKLFPHKKKAKVVVVDFQGNILKDLAEQIRIILSPIIEFDKREFLSHLTLARIVDIYNAYELKKTIESISIDRECFIIEQFVLKQSVLSSQGPTYTDLQTYKLI